MTAFSYRHYAGFAERWLLEERPQQILIGSPGVRPTDERKAIYIVVNSRGECCYVGQTRPRSRWSGAAAARLRQHLADPSKRAEWASYWVIPLRDDTPNDVLNQLERRICLRLQIPLRHRRRH